MRKKIIKFYKYKNWFSLKKIIFLGLINIIEKPSDIFCILNFYFRPFINPRYFPKKLKSCV